MSRFFKSAAFPILIVVVLAFFAQKLISPGSPQRQNTFADFQTQLANGQIAKATVKTKDNTIDVVLRDKSKYEVGFVDDYGRKLTDQLAAAERTHKIQDFTVEGRKSNGWLSLLTYVLPFLIFIGFWIFLMNQVQGGGSKVMSFGKSREADDAGFAEDRLQGRRGRRRGRRGAPGDQGVPREPEEVPGSGRAHSEGRAAVRPARYR